MNVETALKNFDNPIHSFDEDLLQRRGYVENLCRVFQLSSPFESTVFALYGEWGSGKTSVKNLMLNELKNQGNKSPFVIEFNPWAFSGQDQVLEAFFTEVGKAIGETAEGKDAANGFKKLGAYLNFGSKTISALHLGMDFLGIPGSKLIGMVGQGLRDGSERAKELCDDIALIGTTSLKEVQRDLIRGLEKLKRPLLIVLDDLDRLTPDQLLTVFQIVKQNANLPGVNYLMLMDIETIAEHLKQKQLGQEFIEKIIQFNLTLPQVLSEDLKVVLKDGFKTVARKYERQIRWERWDEAWTNGTQNLFTTLRRVKRFLHTLKFTLAFFENDDVLEVDPVDLFLIETVRTFSAETYSAIPREFRDAVIFEYDLLRVFRLQTGQNEGEHGKKNLAALLAHIPDELRNPLEKILVCLFPQIEGGGRDADRNEWLRASRICDHLSFDSYFRMAIPRKAISQKEMADLFGALGNQRKFRRALMALYKKAGIDTLFHRIFCHREKLNAKHLPSILAEIWKLEDTNAEKDGIERDWSTREYAQHITRLLLEQFSSKSDRCRVVATALAKSKVFYPLAFIWVRDRDNLNKNPGSMGTSFDSKDLEILRPIILKEIHVASSDGRLLKMPDLGICLKFWLELENKETVHNWVDEQMKDNSSLFTILRSLISKHTTIRYSGPECHYSIPRQNLEQFFDPIESLESSLLNLEPNTLPHWDKFAVQETLKRISEKRRGVQEAEYGI